MAWLRAAKRAAQPPDAIDVGSLAEALKGNDPPLVVDVRTPAEFRAGHIPGALTLPLHQIGARAHELPRDREIVCVCRSGHRSAVATSRLRGLGWTALNMTGGMLAWRGPVTPGLG